MTMIGTDYRGYRITYNDNMGKWRCSALDVEGDQLSAVRRKIDQTLTTERKKTRVPCIYIWNHCSYTDPPVLHDAEAIDYRQQRKRRWIDNEEQVIHEVGIMVQTGRDERKKKKWVNLNELVPVEHEDLDRLVRAMEAQHSALKAAKVAAEDSIKAIPRLPLEALGDLIRVAEGQE